MPGNFAEFGPEASGSRLAELDHAADISNSMKSLMLFSQMAENDAQMPLYKAQARKAGAEADNLELEAAANKKMADLVSGKGALGPDENIGYVMANLARQAGRFDTATKWQVRGSQVEANQARTGVAQLEQDVKELETVRRQFGLMGSLASQVVDQPSHDRFLATAQAMHLPIDGIPADYESAKSGLSEITAHAMTVKQQLDAAIADKLAKGKEKVDAATIRARGAAESASTARSALIRERLKNVQKNEGENSSAALELKKELAKESKGRQNMRDMKTPSPIPSDRGQREVGKVYLWTDGKTKVVWDKKPDGSMGAREITPAEATKWDKIKGAASSVAGMFSGSSDDDVLAGEGDDDGDD